MLRAIKPGQRRPQGRPHPVPQARQPMPGAGGAGDSEATQLLRPVGGGTPTPPPGTPFGTGPGAPGTGPGAPGAGPGAPGAGPGAPGDRPTPAEFEGLFRDGPGAQPAGGPGGHPVDAADATAQLPRFEDQGRPRPPYEASGQGYARQFPPGGGHDPYDQQAFHDEDGGGRRRRLAPVAIIGGVVVLLAGAGLGLGWMLSGGGSDDGEKKPAPGNSAGPAAGPAEKKDEPKPAADPAEGQAKGLDALLADSNNSRSSVIGAVNDIKSCDNLAGAANDLRAAAGQRNDLVERLKKLPVDRIGDHAALTAALTKAWESSAAADNHYAAWAGQVADKKGCHKGKARATKETSQGNAASGQATQAKKEAARLWNPLARKYGLTERRPEQL